MKKEGSKITPGELRIEKLSANHDLGSFESYEQELVDFLNEDALENQSQNLSVTFLWFYEGSLVGYITLLNDRINLECSLKTFFKEKGVLYKSLPALKVGRICVHDKFRRQGLGKLMMLFAIKIATEIGESKAGCRFITLDAKRNPDPNLDSIHFYKRLGFQVLKPREKGTIPMYLDLRISN